MKELTPRKWADVIHAWAEGADVQFLNLEDQWVDDAYPSFFSSLSYRVKPQVDQAHVSAIELELECLDDRRIGLEAELRQARGLT